MFFGEFGLIPFSTPRTLSLITTDKAIFRERLTALVGVGSIDNNDIFFRESNTAKVYLSMALLDKIDLIDNFEAKIELSMAVLERVLLSDEVLSLCNLGAIKDNKITIKESTETKTTIGSIKDEKQIIIENAETKCAIGIIKDNIISLFDNVSAVVWAKIFETQTDIVNVTLNPNDELRIDSENYTVTLNGTNILYLYEGDFVEVTRKLAGLTVTTGNGGNFEGDILYKERYL